MSEYVGQELACATKRLSVSENLQREKENLESRLKEINEVLKVLEQYPDMTRVIDIVSKFNRF